MLSGPLGDALRQIGLADSDLSHVSRAIAWIRDNFAEPMRVEDLARLSGMSASAFHRHFRAVTAMSPLQFQKRIRLQRARSLLVADPGDIAGVGHLVGYDSPSQFNREYRRLFGAPPAWTLSACARKCLWSRRFRALVSTSRPAASTHTAAAAASLPVSPPMFPGARTA